MKAKGESLKQSNVSFINEYFQEWQNIFFNDFFLHFLWLELVQVFETAIMTVIYCAIIEPEFNYSYMVFSTSISVWARLDVIQVKYPSWR